MTAEILMRGRVARTLPQPDSDGARDGAVARVGRYDELEVLTPITTRHLLADEGSYFVATNPTPGSTLAQALTTAFADTTPALYLHNGDSPSNSAAKRVYLDYMKFVVTVVPASASDVYFAIVLDSVARSLGTDNTLSLTPLSPNMDVPKALSVVDVLKAQNSTTASVITASSNSKRVIARGALGGLPIVGDELIIQFGANDVGAYGATSLASRKVTNAPPVILGPNHSLTLHMWWPSVAVTPMTYEFEMGWWER